MSHERKINNHAREGESLVSQVNFSFTTHDESKSIIFFPVVYFFQKKQKIATHCFRIFAKNQEIRLADSKEIFCTYPIFLIE